MEDYYNRPVENLGKLKRNETQMTAEQKEQYKKPLLKLRKEIAADATEAMKEFITMGMRLGEDPDSETWKSVIRETNRLLDDWINRGKLKEVSKVLFSTYDLDAFFTALCPIHTTIWFKAYGEYWLKHCTKQEDPEYPYHNDIIDMDWWAEHHEWALLRRSNNHAPTDKSTPG